MTNEKSESSGPPKTSNKVVKPSPSDESTLHSKKKKKVKLVAQSKAKGTKISDGQAANSKELKKTLKTNTATGTSKEEENDPLPGRAPIPLDKLVRHQRGKAQNIYRGVKTSAKKLEVRRKEKKIKYAAQQAARAEMLLPEEGGYLEAEEDEFTSQFRQEEIKRSVDITSATKQFDLSLQFGPYAIDYSRNGRKMLIGGKKGHIAAFDWVTKDLTCELNAMETVYDVAWLHNETLFAVAQKEWTYIYDNQGIEVHCIKKLDRVLKMEFLPYHFLLATSSDKGWLSWLDVSMGKMVKQFPTRLGRLNVMTHNPMNAVLCCGHAKGTVTMWTPNFEAPVVKMLCHKQPVRSVAIDQRGWYMATSAVDSTLKIWDLRTYNCLQSYKIGCGASNLAFSQKGLLAASLGNIVEVYKDMCTERVQYPYLKHHVGSSISGLEFCPYEDVLGVSHANGMCSMLIPGAGEPNFDALETNPFQTKSQRKEAEVKSLLEKIQPELITLNPSELGEVDRPTIIEKFEEKTRYMFKKPPKLDVRQRKNAKSVSQFRTKSKLQEEERKKQVAAIGVSRKELLDASRPEKERTETTKPTVLDRFKPKAKKLKTA